MIYQHQEYPKCLYHHKHAPEGKIFQSAEETKGLERKGWVDSPAKFPARSKLRLIFEKTTGIIGKFWRSICELCMATLSMVNWFYIFIGLSIAGSFSLLWYLNKLELFPATIFGGVAAFFGYHAYRFSKEKFRLDLFEKRFAIYEKTLEFCSIVTKYGALPRRPDNEEEIIQGLQAAELSFRGIGWHKTRALFGEDIHQLFQKLNESYAFLRVFSDPTNIDNRQQWANDIHQHLIFVVDTVNKLPDLFSPYIYFGDYKK